MKRFFSVFLLLAAFTAVGTTAVHAQGVTTGAITGVISTSEGPLTGAQVVAVHVPSGTRYGAVTRGDGRYLIPGMRVGGPYTVTVTHIGYENGVRQNVTVNLGVTNDVQLQLRQQAVQIEGIDVTAEAGGAILSPNRTGAATAVSREALENLPTISRRIEDFARLTPQYSGAGFGFSFAGQDNRLNNMTVDGSYFNNSFGLAGQPGDRTGVAPISLDAIEQVQINVAPFDVRQGNFVGAGVNTVTRSGTNDYRGSLSYIFRNQDYVGETAKALTFNPGTFDFSQLGGWLSGPIMKDKLFFFASYENEEESRPLTNFTANAGGEQVVGNKTRVLKSDLETLSTFLSTKLGYEAGPYEGYQDLTPGKRYLAKLDFNVNQKNKLSLRYNHLDSKTDVILSGSSSLGFGRGSNSTNFLGFQNSNYQILENIRSIVGEWNSMIGSNMSNNMIIGYTYQDESRASRGEFFPFVDILSSGTTYTSFGFEPFTPSNELRYKSLQFQNNFTRFGAKHTLTFGISGERYESENVFFPGSQSAYVYNSMADFYADANAFIAACPNEANWKTCSGPAPTNVTRRFQVRYANIPGQTKPVQPLEVLFAGVYAQDEFQVNTKLKLTAGLRMDIPFFGETAFTNAAADALTFRDEDGNPVQYETGKLPDPKPLFSPRIGFNLDAAGDRSTQIRGGTGIFTGRPAYVWISNQIGNTGVLTGFTSADNTRAFPFHPDPDRYKPTAVTGAPAATYELALTDKDFKFPQLWRTNIAVDQKLPWGFVGTGEFLYSKDVNGVYYINANLPAPQTTVTDGSDVRPRFTNTRIHANVSNATVLKNQNEGYSWNASAALEKSFENGLYVKAAYMQGIAKNTVDPGSIASGSFTGNETVGNPNLAPVAYSDYSPGHRLFAAVAYRRDLFSFGSTAVSLYAERRTNGNTSYAYNGDMNGDGQSFNDLLYIHKNTAEMNFVQYTQNAIVVNGVTTVPARTFTVAEQQAAWDAFIEQDPYLSEHRGEVAERNAVFIPDVFRVDFNVTQDLFTSIGGKRNAVQLRVDVLNFTNFLKSDWGVGQRLVTTQPITNGAVDATGKANYRLRNISNGSTFELIDHSFEQTSGINDVWRMQFSLKYTFN